MWVYEYLLYIYKQQSIYTRHAETLRRTFCNFLSPVQRRVPHYSSTSILEYHIMYIYVLHFNFNRGGNAGCCLRQFSFCYDVVFATP